MYGSLCAYVCVHMRRLVQRPRTTREETRGENEGRKGENFTRNGKGDVIPWISCVVR